jgi:hypothetical protein
MSNKINPKIFSIPTLYEVLQNDKNLPYNNYNHTLERK